MTMADTYIIQISKDDKFEKNDKELNKVKSKSGVTLNKEMEFDDFKTVSLEVENEEQINGLRKDGNIVEKNQIFRKQDIQIKNSSWNNLKNWFGSFFFNHNLNTHTATHVDFPDIDLSKIAIGTTNNFDIDKRLWNMSASRAPEAWKYGFTGKGINIAVLDTGIVPHVDLDKRILEGKNTVGPGAPSSEVLDKKDFHGVHVSGTISGDNSSKNNFYGVAPDASIIPIKVLGDDGFGSMDDIIEGLQWAKKLNADIVNMSLGGGNYSAILHNVIKDLTSNGICIIVAAGNESADKVSYPAAYDEVIPVAAYNKYNKISYFSNSGDKMINGLAAPGEEILSCSPNNSYRYLNGTSMATPSVSGAAALLKQIDKNKVTPQIIRESLNEGAIEIQGYSKLNQGNGKLDIPNSIVLCNRKCGEPKIENTGLSNAKFGSGSRGDIVLSIQSRLKDLGHYTKLLDGIFGPITANAVLSFTKNERNFVDVPTYKELMEKDFPDIFDRSLEVTASFEGTGYGKAVGNFDGAILTWGIIGFTLAHGSLAEVLTEIYLKDKNLLKDTFGSENNRLVENIEDYLKWNRKKLKYFVQWGKSIQDQQGRIKPFYISSFRKLGDIEIVQQIQKDYAKSMYWARALNFAEIFELKEDLSLAMCFDAAVQGFNKKGLDLAKAEKNAQRIIKGSPLDEMTKRKIIATANAETCLPRWKADVWSRRSLFIDARIGDVHGRTYNLKNWGLNY